MSSHKVLFSLLCLTFSLYLPAQSQPGYWNGHRAAVILTYDDGLDQHLDIVIPALDSLGLKGTFYIPGNAPSLSQRMDEWRAAALGGHELGNHTLFHPCAGSPEGRSWVSSDYDLDTYTTRRITDEIRLANTLLKAVDGKDLRSFAYTCGDTHAGDAAFDELIKNDFSCARSVNSRYELPGRVDLLHIGAFAVMDQSGSELASYAQTALENSSLIVFLFHGVGGGHSMNVSREAHEELLRYLDLHSEDIWVAPLSEVGLFLKNKQK